MRQRDRETEREAPLSLSLPEQTLACWRDGERDGEREACVS